MEVTTFRGLFCLVTGTLPTSTSKSYSSACPEKQKLHYLPLSLRKTAAGEIFFSSSTTNRHAGSTRLFHQEKWDFLRSDSNSRVNIASKEVCDSDKKFHFMALFFGLFPDGTQTILRIYKHKARAPLLRRSSS
jgi:hypothetical protein